MENNIDDEYEYTEEIIEEEPEHKPIKGIVKPADFSLPLYSLFLQYSKDVFYALLPQNIKVTRGSFVVVPTKYGVDLAKVISPVEKPIHACIEEITTIIRSSTQEDLDKQNENLQKESEACKIFKERASAHGLKMKLIAAHFLLGEPKVLFFFSADNRVDFLKLVKDLVSAFKIRVELRQIGVRDEARMIGGLGCCGRPYCCTSISDKIQTVSIKMVKEQGISLSSLKVSGQCGRLLCCLGYEYEWYAEERKYMPSEGTKLEYDGTIFKVIELNHLKKSITLKSEDDKILTINGSQVKKQGNVWEII